MEAVAGARRQMRSAARKASAMKYERPQIERRERLTGLLIPPSRQDTFK